MLMYLIESYKSRAGKNLRSLSNPRPSSRQEHSMETFHFKSSRKKPIFSKIFIPPPPKQMYTHFSTRKVEEKKRNKEHLFIQVTLSLFYILII